MANLTRLCQARVHTKTTDDQFQRFPEVRRRWGCTSRFSRSFQQRVETASRLQWQWQRIPPQSLSQEGAAILLPSRAAFSPAGPKLPLSTPVDEFNHSTRD